MLLLRSIISISLLYCANAAPSSRPTVTLSSGAVVGTTSKAPSATAPANRFLGIPFAASPPERFSPPTDPKRWSKPLDASAFKPACIQQFNYPEATRNKTMAIFNNPGNAPPKESEDCLYLNVFTPTTSPPAGGRTTLVWIYGGNLQFGTGSLEFYDGSAMAANQDVVVVTMNYRTNVFGFSNSPEIAAGKQNSGFLDQRKALDWVQKNIHLFGGDPKKITIFGESAGAFSVKQLIATPPDPLPFRAAILESQGATASNGNSSYNELLVLTQCATATSKLACLRALPATTLKNIIEKNNLAFFPVADKVTSVTDARVPIQAGTAAKVPILQGSNSQEGRVFAYVLGLDLADETALRAYLNTTFPGQTALQNAILNAYPSEIANVPYYLISAVITDLIFTCTTSALTNRLNLAGYDVWRYYYQAAFPNLSIFPDAGAYHSSEIPQIFGTWPTEGATETQKQLTRYMQKAWTDFAKNPQGGPGWPKLGSNFGRDIGALGRNGGGGETTIARAEADSICALYAPLIAAGRL